MGCREYIGDSFYAFLARPGVCGTQRRRMCERVVQVVLNGSLDLEEVYGGKSNGVGLC